MVFLNGLFLPLEEAKIPVLDRGFIFGDGIYEFIPVYARVPFRLAEHFARLERSLHEARIRNPYSRAAWQRHIAELISRQPFDNQGVYLQVTRGVARRDHSFPVDDIEPTVFMMSNPLVNPAAELIENGVAAVTAEDFRWLRCDIKTTSLLANCLLRQYAAESGAAEAILLRDGKLTEASASNVFLVKDGLILAPPKSNLILPGITYDVVVELARGAGLPVELREIDAAELRGADEIWLTSSSKEVVAVSKLDGAAVGSGRPGPLFRQLHALYQQFKLELMRTNARERLSA
jgi:D-alanine transaminase